MAHHKTRNKDPANMDKPFDRSNNELKRLLEESVSNIDKKRRPPLRTEQDSEPTFSRLSSDRPSTSQGHDDSCPLATVKRYPKSDETDRTRDSSPKQRSPKRENVEEDLHSTTPLESKRQERPSRPTSTGSHRYLEFEDGNVVHLIRSQEKPLTSGDLTPSRVCSECCLTYFKPDLRSLKTPADKTKHPGAAMSQRAPGATPHRPYPSEAVTSKPIKELELKGPSVRARTKRQQPDKDMPQSSKDPGETKRPEAAQLPKELDDEPIIKCPACTELPMGLHPKIVTTKPTVRATIKEQEPAYKNMPRARKELPQSDREKKPVPYVPIPLTRETPVEQKPRHSEQPSPSKLEPETSSGETKPETAPKPIPPYINIKGVTMRPEILLEVVQEPSEPEDINAKLLIKSEKIDRRSECVPPTSKFEPETKDKRSKKSKKNMPHARKELPQSDRENKSVPYVPIPLTRETPVEQKPRHSEQPSPSSKLEPETTSSGETKPETAPKPIPPYIYIKGVTLRPEILLEVVQKPSEPQDINAKLLIKKSKKVPYVLPLVPSTKSPLEQKASRSERDPSTSKVEPEAKDKRSLTSPEKVPPSVPLTTGESPIKQKSPPTSKLKPETKDKSSFPEKAQEPAPKPISPYVHVRGVTLRPEILLEIVEPLTSNAAFLNITERTDSAIGTGIIQKPDSEDASKKEPVIEEKPPLIIAVPSSKPEPTPESSEPEQSEKEEEKPAIETEKTPVIEEKPPLIIAVPSSKPEPTPKSSEPEQSEKEEEKPAIETEKTPVIEEKPPTEPSGKPEQSKKDETTSTESQASVKPESVPEKKTEDDATKRGKKTVAPLSEDTLSDTSVEFCPSDEETCGFEVNKYPVKKRTRSSMMDKFKSRFGAGDKR